MLELVVFLGNGLVYIRIIKRVEIGCKEFDFFF